MKYATGLINGVDSGLEADVTALDVLHDLIAHTILHNGVVTSCTVDGIDVPEHLRDMKVLGSLFVQNAEDIPVMKPVYLIEDTNENHEADNLLLRILELDSCGTGFACRIIPVLEASDKMNVGYYKESPEGELRGLV